ncbi:MAG: NAD-dependent epimerase/dehydratase family protein [Bacteroidota bacterium]
MNIFVTGGSGRLGNVLVKKLLSKYPESEVEVLVTPKDKYEEALAGLPLKITEGSILDRPLIKQLTKGKDAVFHLAAKISLFPDKDGSVWKTNVEGTRIIAEESLKVSIGKFIHCSSHHAVEKEPYSSPMDESRPLALEDRTTYHRSKAYAEKIILELVGQGLKAVIINPGTVIGPEDYGPSILGKALIDFFNGKIPFLMNGMSDYADVRDISDGIIAAFEKGRVGERYFLTGHMLSMKEIPTLVRTITGKKLPRNTIPIKMMYTLLPFINALSKLKKEQPLFTKDMLYASQSNPSVLHEKAKKEIGFKPRSTEETFRDSFEWYRKKGWINY